MTVTFREWDGNFSKSDGLLTNVTVQEKKSACWESKKITEQEKKIWRYKKKSDGPISRPDGPNISPWRSILKFWRDTPFKRTVRGQTKKNDVKITNEHEQFIVNPISFARFESHRNSKHLKMIYANKQTTCWKPIF